MPGSALDGVAWFGPTNFFVTPNLSQVYVEVALGCDKILMNLTFFTPYLIAQPRGFQTFGCGFHNQDSTEHNFLSAR